MPPVQSTESPHRGSQSLFLGTAKGMVIWGSMAAQGMQASSRYRDQESITLLHQALRVRLILQDSLSVTVCPCYAQNAAVSEDRAEVSNQKPLRCQCCKTHNAVKNRQRKDRKQSATNTRPVTAAEWHQPALLCSQNQPQVPAEGRDEPPCPHSLLANTAQNAHLAHLGCSVPFFPFWGGRGRFHHSGKLTASPTTLLWEEKQHMVKVI